jgi:hypothetical protein
MNSTAPKPARPDQQTPRPTGPEEEARAAQLQAANINPRTGLATDYLNHFNEAIMLLEMIPDMPECAEEFLEWQPRSYREHFAASNFKARELAIEAYDSAHRAGPAGHRLGQTAGDAGRRHHQWPRRRG